MKRRNVTASLIVVTGLLGALVFAASLLPHERLLMSRATKVADVKGWMPRQPVRVTQNATAVGGWVWPDLEKHTFEHVWLSDNRLFVAASGSRLRTPFFYDIPGCTQTPLVRLMAHLEKDNSAGIDTWEVSPDRHWLLWTVTAHNDVRASRLDGTGYQSISLPPPAVTFGHIRWDQDSHHWYAAAFEGEYGSFTRVFSGDVNYPGHSHFLPITYARDLFDPDIKVLVRIKSRSNILDYSVVVKPHDRNTAPHKYPSKTLYLPSGKEISEVVQNNGRDRLAWLLLSTRTPPFAEWLGRFVLSYAVPRTFAEVWISRIDGTKMHSIGSVVINGEEQPDSLKWLPSDRRLSFLYKDALWTVPAD